MLVTETVRAYVAQHPSVRARMDSYPFDDPPSWWMVKKCIPDQKIATRWEGDGEEVYEVMGIPWRLLAFWHNKVSTSLVDAVNDLIKRANYPARIKAGNERVEKELKSCAGKVSRTIKGATGGAKQAEMGQQFYKLHLRPADMVNVHSLMAHNKDLEKKVVELEAEAARLLVEMGEELEREKKRVSELEEENEALREAVEKMLFGEELRVNKTLRPLLPHS